MTSSMYSGPYFLFIAATVSAWSISLILMPGVLARSVTAAVGRPPTQKNASILRSLSAFTDSATPSRSRFMSRSLSRPAASMTRNPITSVALPGEPVETRLPFRSAIFVMPMPYRDHVHAIGIQNHQGAQGYLGALELVLAAVGVLAGVCHGKPDIRFASGNQLEVVHRATGHLGRSLQARHVLGQDVR